MTDLLQHYLDAHDARPRPELAARREEIITRTAELESYARRSQAQNDELGGLIAEQIAVDDLIKRHDVDARRAEISRVEQAAADPANCESGDGGGAPALVRGLGDRRETPAEVIQRAGNPWRNADTTTGGVIARAHTAVEALAERFGHDGAEKLAGLLAERDEKDYRAGVWEIRTLDEVRRSAELVLALSSPHYETAFGKVLRDPMAFRSGMGVLRWSDEEREAFHQVELSRTALFESASGAYILPLVLDDTILLTNAGAANPWRRVCRNVTTTSNTWNGATSAGVTAHWYSEGTITSDDTPVLVQLQVTPHMEEAWAFSSYEQIADSRLGANIPALMDDAFNRLEEAAFTTGAGDGSNQPWGAITRATADSNTGLVNVANAVAVFSLLNNCPVRFRDPGNGAKPYFVANIAVINLLRALTAFTAATASIVDDSGPVPRIFGIPLLESTTMDAANTTGGHKNLLLFDANSFLVVNRLGTQLLYEPMVKGTGGILPAREGGWLAYRRVGSDAVTATALRVHNNA